MKKYQASRGWRNNNPLNIRRTATEWQGLVAKQNRTDKEFCQFLNMTWGYRAAYKVLKSYYRYFAQQGKPCTVEAVISRWAPPLENDTQAYLQRVCDLLNESPNAVIAPGTGIVGDRHTAWLMAAMTCVECGCPPYAVNYGAISTGIVLGGGKRIEPEEIRL